MKSQLGSPPISGRTSKIVAPIHDANYDLKMGCGELIEFEDRTGVGCYYAMQRLVAIDAAGQLIGDFRIEWVVQAIRLGLNGGGMKPLESLALVDRVIRGGYIMDYLETAYRVLFVGLHGPENEPLTPDEESPGEPQAEG